MHGAGTCRALQASPSRGSERIILLQLHLSYTQKGSLAQGLLPPQISLPSLILPPSTDHLTHPAFFSLSLMQVSPTGEAAPNPSWDQEPFLGADCLHPRENSSESFPASSLSTPDTKHFPKHSVLSCNHPASTGFLSLYINSRICLITLD